MDICYDKETGILLGKGEDAERIYRSLLDDPVVQVLTSTEFAEEQGFDAERMLTDESYRVKFSQHVNAQMDKNRSYWNG